MSDQERYLDEVLSVIARRARVSNLSRTAEVASVLDELPDAPPERVDHAVRTAHQLAGSAGTFGDDRASALARALEDFLADATSRGDPEQIEQARHRLGELRQSLEDS